MPLSSAVRGQPYTLSEPTKSSNDDDISTNPASGPGARNIQRGNAASRRRRERNYDRSPLACRLSARAHYLPCRPRHDRVESAPQTLARTKQRPLYTGFLDYYCERQGLWSRISSRSGLSIWELSTGPRSAGGRSR